MRKVFWLAMALLWATPALAVEVAGIDVPDSVKLEGQTLNLNGAGIRTKFFFDIYVGALYLASKATTTDQVLAATGPKRVSMVFVYGEVGREKLTDGWSEGFEKNQSARDLEALSERLNRFNGWFSDAHKGEVYTFDFMPDGSTVVTLNGKKAGRIEGGDFQRALLKVWFGKHPADGDLKEAMLGG